MIPGRVGGFSAGAVLPGGSDVSGKDHDSAQTVIAIKHLTGRSRGEVTWLAAPDCEVTLDAGYRVHVLGTHPEPHETGAVARFRLVDRHYEIEPAPGHEIWVNGRRVSVGRLNHGDTIEFGETGPLCRLRYFAEHTPVRNSVADIFGDVRTYLRVSRQRPARRAVRAAGALLGRLTFETTVLFRVTVLVTIAGLVFVAYQQQQMNTLLRRDIENAAAQLDNVGAALVSARKEALRPGDMAALRSELERRLLANVSRLEELEQRSTAAARVIAASSDRIAFLQGIYGFRERAGARMLRQAVNADGVPLLSLRGRPLLTLEGDGPVVELQFTGTGFLAGQGEVLVTNRHVALPWENSMGAEVLGALEVEPVMVRFIAYLPDNPEPVPLSLLRASEDADLALLRLEDGPARAPGLRLSGAPPRSGDEIIVMGFPTGLRSLLAQSGPEFIKELEAAENTGFWDVASRLAEEGYIAPLASRGIVGQVTASAIVYDAETTTGGSGGPVLDIDGRVVAVNSAILPEFGGSNLGVPGAAVRVLLEQAGIR